MSKNILLTYPQLALAIERKLLINASKYKIEDPIRMEYVLLALQYNAVSQLLPVSTSELDISKIKSNIEGYSEILKMLRKVVVEQGCVSDVLKAYLVVNPDYNFDV